MSKSIGLHNARSYYARTLRRHMPGAAVLTFALMLTPCLIDTARAADLPDLKGPVVATGHVATDSTVICTFWSGLGTDTPFVLTDKQGTPVSWPNWVALAASPTLNRFFHGLQGLLFLASPDGQEWLRSDSGKTWGHSPKGQAFIDDFAKKAPEDKAVEYVNICAAQGASYYYIPGTEMCLKVGGYIRHDDASADANAIKDYDGLVAGLKASAGSGLSPEALEYIARNFSAYRQSAPSSQQDANQPDQNVSGQIQVQRGFGDMTQLPPQPGAFTANGTTSPNAPSQAGQQDTNQPDADLTGRQRLERAFGDADGTTTPSNAASKADRQADSKVTVRVSVKGKVPDGADAPPVPGQLVSLVNGNLEPDLPMFGMPRTADQENAGADMGAPLGRSDGNGIAEFMVSSGDLGNLMGRTFFQGNGSFKDGYTLNGSVSVQKHGGFYISRPLKIDEEWSNNIGNLAKGSIAGVTYQSTEFSIGGKQYWDVNYAMDYNIVATADQVKQDIIKTLQEKQDPNLSVPIDGNTCRIELPANVTGPYSPVPQLPMAGIPEATIGLAPAMPRIGGAP